MTHSNPDASLNGEAVRHYLPEVQPVRDLQLGHGWLDPRTIGALSELVPDWGLTRSPRKLWYNPVLDPHVRAAKFTNRWLETTNQYESGGPLNVPDAGHPFNLISSLREDGMHSPAIDIDLETRRGQPLEASTVRRLVAEHAGVDESGVIAVPSSRYWHAYVPQMSFAWPTYLMFLKGMSAQGIVESAWVEACESRGQSLLRPPHIRKEQGLAATDGR